MPESVTAVVLLGASEFPHHNFGSNPAFFRSKRDFRAYLQDGTIGLGVTDSSILDMFESKKSPGDQLEEIGKFLSEFESHIPTGVLRNLIIYYVGHGLFPERSQAFCLALACTKMDYEPTSSLRTIDLGGELKYRAKNFRKFVFLDCCFAGAALADFQGSFDDVVSRAAFTAFENSAPREPRAIPLRGTALFCASDHEHPARSPAGLVHTMFSGAMLQALKTGNHGFGTMLNMLELKDLTWEKLGAGTLQPIRPVLHSPDQSQGDIATSVLLFPNPAQISKSKSKQESRPTEGKVTPMDLASQAYQSDSTALRPAPKEPEVPSSTSAIGDAQMNRTLTNGLFQSPVAGQSRLPLPTHRATPQERLGETLAGYGLPPQGVLPRNAGRRPPFRRLTEPGPLLILCLILSGCAATWIFSIVLGWVPLPYFVAGLAAFVGTLAFCRPSWHLATAAAVGTSLTTFATTIYLLFLRSLPFSETLQELKYFVPLIAVSSIASISLVALKEEYF